MKYYFVLLVALLGLISGRKLQETQFGDGQMPNFGDFGGQMPNFGDGQMPTFGQ